MNQSKWYWCLNDKHNNFLAGLGYCDIDLDNQLCFGRCGNDGDPEDCYCGCYDWENDLYFCCSYDVVEETVSWIEDK